MNCVLLSSYSSIHAITEWDLFLGFATFVSTDASDTGVYFSCSFSKVIGNFPKNFPGVLWVQLL